MASKKRAIDFHRSADSPFPDGYDLGAEKEVVAHLIEADNPDPTDPLYQRFVLFEERERALRQLQAEHTLRQQANREVPLAEATVIDDIGMLVQDGEDEMTLHTRDAMRLFLGRDAEPGRPGSQMAGGKKIAAALKQVWFLSSRDNPYADWCLIEMGERTDTLRQQMATENTRILQAMDALKARGLSYSIVKSAAPVVTRLGFRSPYGFGIASLMVEFDYCARVIKSAQRRDMLSYDQAKSKLYNQKKSARSIFEYVLRFQKYLSKPEMLALSRADFIPGATVDAVNRVKAAAALFGACPRDILNGDKQPRHSRRRVRMTDEEYRLLSAVPMDGKVEGDDDVSEHALI